MVRFSRTITLWEIMKRIRTCGLNVVDDEDDDYATLHRRISEVAAKPKQENSSPGAQAGAQADSPDFFSLIPRSILPGRLVSSKCITVDGCFACSGPAAC